MSPDMLTPCVNPVTAGKKMANRNQNGRTEEAFVQFREKTASSHRGSPPQKKETSAKPKKMSKKILAHRAREGDNQKRPMHAACIHETFFCQQE
jgi:hypothetical protein